MGEFVKTLVVKIKANSVASDTTMRNYGDCLICHIENHLTNLKFDSQFKRVFINRDDSKKVDLEIEIDETENLQR